jgi:hypothetical protein
MFSPQVVYATHTGLPFDCARCHDARSSSLVGEPREQAMRALHDAVLSDLFPSHSAGLARGRGLYTCTACFRGTRIFRECFFFRRKTTAGESGIYYCDMVFLASYNGHKRTPYKRAHTQSQPLDGLKQHAEVSMDGTTGRNPPVVFQPSRATYLDQQPATRSELPPIKRPHHKNSRIKDKP